MKINNEIPDVGIIGCGPRGLSALESLYLESALHKKLPKVIIFEIAEYPGAGPVYHLGQPDSNWLNVSERGIGITAREEAKLKDFIIASFPDYQHWSGYAESKKTETDVDKFPLRSKLGKYLHERFLSITNVLEKHGLLTFIKGVVDHIAVEEGLVRIEVVGGKSYRVNEAALCIGHQPIELDQQLHGWKRRVEQLDGIELFTQPYPLTHIVDSTNSIAGRKVAIRGFGLAMIDVARALSEGFGGEFKLLKNSTREMKYKPSGKEPESILAFSLDGLPMAPKPLNEKVDKLYVPADIYQASYEQSVTKNITSDEGLSSTDFLIRAITPLIVEKFSALGSHALEHFLTTEQLTEIILDWLSDECFSHDLILSKELTAEATMEKFVAMATGQGKVSLDYCIGQVWRHMQPTMYRLLSFAPLADDLIGEIVKLDERLKRYSYGPPIDSLQQILALVRSGNVNLDYVKDPEINLEEDGWRFSCNGHSTIVDTMVNSVLDSPQILKVVSPLPKGLINNPMVEPLHDKLGVRTRKDALIEIDGKNNSIPVAMMGRLAKGTLIGVDAIAECFGERSAYWAEGVVERMRKP